MEKNKVWMGIDIGSSSTKAVLINKNKKIVESSYIVSRNIDDSIREVLEKISVKKYEVMGVGTTGSGREYAKQLISADLAKTEIIAHAIGTLQIIPSVKTIIDIGCEDCKIILLEEGVMRDFNLNTICSSGMGATLENIASRLGIDIEEFGDLALKSDKEVILPMKCGVIMSSSVISKKNAGEKVENILMAVCNSVVRNFLNLTSKGKNIEEPIVFQGMTAHNKGLVKAFKENLGKDITIPNKPELMGAYGMAILTQEEMGNKKTSFTSEFKSIKKVKINHQGKDCISCGTCFKALPQYFIQDTDGKSRCIETTIEEKDIKKVKEVAKLCPLNLIEVKIQ